MMMEVIVALLVLAGGIFCFGAGLGVLRLPDVLIRMHASTKAGTVGPGLILTAVALAFGEGAVIARAAIAILFLLLTAPVAAHLIGRAAFRTGIRLMDRTTSEAGVTQALLGPDRAARD